MPRVIRRRMSHVAGWLADRRIPGPLRRPLIGAYCRATGADPGEAQLEPRGYTSLGAFFVRRLRPGARPVHPDPLVLPSPCDGRIQAVGPIREGSMLQAKGQDYPVRELLAGLGEDVDLEGAHQWTIYLSPRDYHRVHAPEDGALTEVRWVPGERRSVAPKVALRRERLFATNERVVMRLETERGPLLLVMVGALNVGRIRIVGLGQGESPPRDAPIRFERGDELGRFELGSTVILIAPRGDASPATGIEEGRALRLGEAIGMRPGDHGDEADDPGEAE